MILYYKNSFLASIVSMAGCFCAIMGFATFQEDPGSSILTLLLAAFLLFEGWNISQSKNFNKWWKQVKDANLEPEIAKSADLAIKIYQKNPCKRTLNRIRQLNPDAASLISQSISK